MHYQHYQRRRTITIRRQREYPTSQTFTVRCLGRIVYTTVTRTPSVVRRWIHQVLAFHSWRLHALVVGLGVQWRERFRRADSDPVATIQLCVGCRCLVFQVFHAHGIPNALVRFLADPRITFVSVGMGRDRKKLMDHCRLRVGRGHDLRRLAGNWASTEKLAREYLDFDGFEGEMKPKSVGLSNWEQWELSDAQVQYACVDTYASFRLGLELQAASY